MIHALPVAKGSEKVPRAPSRARAVGFSAEHSDAALVHAWQRLESSSFLPTQSHAFSAALACTLLVGTCIELFLASGADGIVALLPMCRSSGPFARWRMMGAREVFEPCDVLGDSPEAVRLVADAIAAQSRPLRLERLPVHSPLLPALRAAMRGKGHVSVRPGFGCPTIALDDSWSEPESRFNSGRRSDFRRAARRAGEFGAVSYEILSPTPAEFDALFDEAVAVELSSWKKEAGTAIASDRAKEDFFRVLFRTACEAGTFRLALMRIDGRAVAMQMALECLGKYWLFKIGYDEEFSRCSPGTLLMLHSLGYAASNRLRAYELLGDVEPWIAEFWTQDQHECVRLFTYPYGPRGAVAFAVDCAAWLVKRVKPGPDR